MIEVGKIYKIGYLGHHPHYGHHFLVGRIEMSNFHQQCWGVCSCGQYNWWPSAHLIEERQTKELKELFSTLILKK